MVDAALRGDHLRLLLRVHGYESPQIRTGTDANWLVGEIELTVSDRGSFQASMPVTVLADEIARFRDVLGQTLARGRGRVALDHLEDELEAVVEVDGDEVVLSGALVDPVLGELRFWDVASDRARLERSLKQFDALVRAFPPRG